MSQPRKKVTAEEFWAGMAELKEQMRDTDRQIKETGLQMKEADRRLEKQRQETDRQIKETGLQMKETDRQFEKQKRETDRRIKYLDELFTGQWGKLMESLVKGDLVNLLNEKNIEVKTLARETETVFKGEPYQFDIIAINGQEVVVVEVKTTLRLQNVKDFIDKLGFFKKVFPYYADKKIYGAIAYLKANEGTDIYSEKQGLFVIRATGSSASITNKKAFKPKVFG